MNTVKRIGLIVGALIVAVLVGQIVNYVTIPKEYETIIVNKDSNGKLYTERQWEWKPVEFKDTINYVSTTEVSKRVVTLHVNECTFIDVTVPDTDVINDYGKTIWAIDGSYTVRIIGNATKDTLSKLAGIDNPIIEGNSISSPVDKEGKKTVAKLIGDYCVVADIYVGDSNYSIIRDSLFNQELSTYEHNNSSYKFNITELSNLIYNGNYCPQIEIREISLSSKRNLFEKGFLWNQSNMIPLYKAERQYIAKLEKLAECSVEEFYTDGGILYAKAGDYYLGLVSYNTNTTISLLGQGDEA